MNTATSTTKNRREASVLSEASKFADTERPLDTYLHGRLLVLARSVWALLVVLVLIVFIASIQVYFAQLLVVCRSAQCASEQLSSDAARSLRHIGLSVTGYAVLMVTLSVVWALVWYATAAVIVWRKSNDRMALLVALMLVMQGAVSVTNTVGWSQSIWQFPALLVNFFAFEAFFLVFVIFPNGRFVPRWTWWLVIVFAVVSICYDFFPSLFSSNTWLTLFDNALWISLVVSLVLVQIYRYRRVSTSTQRQQTKWVVFGFATATMAGVVAYLVTFISPSLYQPGSLYFLIFNPDQSFLMLLIPLSFGVAILRYRLYDIDIIINRALVYAMLTASLALIYFGIILGFQYLLRGFTEKSDLAIVGSTLVIAALFQPLRTRIQKLIDRRFYRRKYDAAKTLAAFSATLHDEINLAQLSEQLIAVVDDTMHPAHVSLWLRAPEREKRR